MPDGRCASDNAERLHRALGKLAAGSFARASTATARAVNGRTELAVLTRQTLIPSGSANGAQTHPHFRGSREICIPALRRRAAQGSDSPAGGTGVLDIKNTARARR